MSREEAEIAFVYDKYEQIRNPLYNGNQSGDNSS